MQATLARWGNSQGLRIPKEVCEQLGIGVGSIATIDLDERTTTITLHFNHSSQHFVRDRKVTMEELCSGWKGQRVGSEWGGADVGSEVVE